MTTLVQDRNDKLRYLLHFAGMRPLSYFSGIVLSDILINFFTMAMFVLVVYIMDITILVDEIGNFTLALLCFGFSFVNMCNVVGLPFTDATKATRLA